MEAAMKPKLGKPIYGLQHHASCPIYKADIEKVLVSHIYNAEHYCRCDAYNRLRKKKERIYDEN